MTTTIDITFPLAERAEEFARRVTEPGWWTINIEHTKGRRRVVWTTENRSHDLTDEMHFLECLDTIGYYGSDMSRKAKATWVERGITRKAPMTY